MPVNRSDLRRLIADFEALPPDTRRELRPALREGAQPMLMAARRNASWSTRIPPATKIATALNLGGSGVTISVDTNAAPHAPLYEGPQSFRHPRWGDKSWWYTQRARPFFAPALAAHEDDVVDAVARAVMDVAERNGF